jgi:hypothetical protein
MIIPSSTHGVIASSRPRVVVAGGGGDVTPNAVNWADVYYNNDVLQWFYSERQITGINTTITLKVEYTTAFPLSLYYHVSNSSGAIVSGDALSAASPAGNSQLLFPSGSTFSVSNNQYVTFSVLPSCGDSVIFTVKNESDGNTTLDTFNGYWEGECF